MKKLVFGSCVLILSTVAVQAAFFDTDDFSSGYTPNVAIDGQKQWSAVGVVVTNSSGVGYANDWAVFFPEGSAATNTVSQSPSKAWTDFRIKPSLGVEPDNPEPDVKSALFFFNSDGEIQVWNGISADWIICTNDVWGHPVPKVSTEYVRVSVYQDFNAKTYAVMLDDRVIVQDVGFPTNSLSNYSKFVVENVDNNAYLDNLLIMLEVPVDLSANSNHVALADALELDQNGYVARTLHVDPSNTAPVPYYASLQTALDAYRTGDIVSVAAGTYAENITISNLITFANAVTIDGTLTITAGGSLTLGAASTVSGAIAIASGGSLIANGSLTAQSSVTVAGSGEFAVNANSSAASLAVNGGNVAIGAGDALEVTGAVSLLNAGSVSIASGGTFTIDGSQSHTMAAGTTIVATDGRFDDGTLDMTGTFTIQGSDYIVATGGTVIEQSLPFNDDLDRYAAGTLAADMKLFGWSAEAGAPSVTDAAAHSGKSIILPDGSSVSLAIDDTNKGDRQVVWTDYYVRPAVGVGPGDSPDTGTRSFLSYVNASGNLVVYDASGNAWVVCNANVTNGTVEAAFSNDAFTRVTVYQNFDTKKYVVFIKGTELVHEGTFPDSVNPPTNFSSLMVENTSGGADAWLDTVWVTATLPLGLSGDHDGDGVEDGYEIHHFGGLTSYGGPRGSVFRFM